MRSARALARLPRCVETAGDLVIGRSGAAGRQVGAGAVTLACALVLQVGLAAGAAAQASPFEAPSQVSLLQDACAGRSYELQEFVRLLRLELLALGVERLDEVRSAQELEEQPPGLAFVHMRCPAEQDQVGVEVSDVLTGKQISRELGVADTEFRARPRALALAVASLIQNSWVELATRDPTRLEALALPGNVRVRLRKRLRASLDQEPPELPPRSAASRKPQPPAPEGPPQRVLALFATARSFPGQNTGLLGADLMYMPALGPLRIALGVEALFGSQELGDSNGAIADVSMVWLSGGLALLWVSATRPELAIGPFGSLGYGVASGRARRPGYDIRSDGSFVGLLGVTALLRAEIAAHVDLWAGLDFGYVPSGVVFLADQGRLAGMADLSMGARAGASYAF